VKRVRKREGDLNPKVGGTCARFRLQICGDRSHWSTYDDDRPSNASSGSLADNLYAAWTSSSLIRFIPLCIQLPAPQPCSVLSLTGWLSRRNVTGLYITTSSGQPGHANKMPTCSHRTSQLAIHFLSLLYAYSRLREYSAENVFVYSLYI